MRSFVQHITSHRLNTLADTAFKLMACRGVNPSRFVEWYATEGILFNEQDVADQAKQWLQQELLLVEGWAGNLARGAVGSLGHLIGKPWRAAVGTGGAALDAAKGAWHGVGDAAQTAGRDFDISAGRQGIQASPMCKTGFYDVATGNCVASQTDKTPVDRTTGQPLPPQQAQQPTSNRRDAAQQANPLQQQIQQAHQALSALSKNMPQDLRKNNSFVMALQSLIGMLQNPPPQQAPSSTAITTAPAPSSTAITTAPVQKSHYDAQSDSPFLQHVLVEQKVRHVVNRMTERGYDPRAFVKWYMSEGRHMSPELFEGRIGDFFGNLWGGVNSWMGGQGFGSGWNQAISNRQDQVKYQAIQALLALQRNGQQLQGYGPDFMKHMQTVMQALGSAPEESAEAEAQPANTETQPGDTSHPADQGEKNYDPTSRFGPKQQSSPTSHPADRGKANYDPASQFGPKSGGQSLDVEKNKPEAQHPDFWDADKVAQLRQQAANGQGDPEIINIHNDPNLNDQQKHEKIASYMAGQARQLNQSTHGDSTGVDQLGTGENYRASGDKEFFESIFKHYRGKSKSWY